MTKREIINNLTERFGAPEHHGDGAFFEVDATKGVLVPFDLTKSIVVYNYNGFAVRYGLKDLALVGFCEVYSKSQDEILF